MRQGDRYWLLNTASLLPVPSIPPQAPPVFPRVVLGSNKEHVFHMPCPRPAPVTCLPSPYLRFSLVVVRGSFCFRLLWGILKDPSHGPRVRNRPPSRQQVGQTQQNNHCQATLPPSTLPMFCCGAVHSNYQTRLIIHQVKNWWCFYLFFPFFWTNFCQL